MTGHRLLQGEDSEYAVNSLPAVTAYLDTALAVLQDAVDSLPEGTESRVNAQYAIQNILYAKRRWMIEERGMR